MMSGVDGLTRGERRSLVFSTGEGREHAYVKRDDVRNVLYFTIPVDGGSSMRQIGVQPVNLSEFDESTFVIGAHGTIDCLKNSDDYKECMRAWEVAER